MTKGGRVTQHKPQRDTTSPLKENRTLKQENASLKKELSKLRKQIGNAIESHVTAQQNSTEESESKNTKDVPPVVTGCAGCGTVGDTVSFQVPGSQTVLSVCKKCGHKERSKK